MNCSSGGVHERRRLVEEAPEQDTEPGGALGTGHKGDIDMLLSLFITLPSSSVVATTSGIILGPVPMLLKAWTVILYLVYLDKPVMTINIP